MYILDLSVRHPGEVFVWRKCQYMLLATPHEPKEVRALSRMVLAYVRQNDAQQNGFLMRNFIWRVNRLITPRPHRRRASATGHVLRN